MLSLWSVVVCMRIDTIQTYDPYGSTVVEQSPFLGSLIIVQDCSLVDNVLVYLCLVRVSSAVVAQLPLLEEKVPDPEILTCL